MKLEHKISLQSAETNVEIGLACFCGSSCLLGCAYSCTGPCSGSCGFICSSSCGNACHGGGICKSSAK